MNILIAVASKHGGTREIGDVLARSFRGNGMQATVAQPEDVTTLDGYDAVVLGSGVYAGHWLDSVRKFADRYASELSVRPVWLFSSGPIGDPPMPVGDVPDALRLRDELAARDHRSFSGRLDRRRLGLLERTITTALKAPDGDFRDWDAVAEWADEISSQLARTEVPA